MSYSNWLDTLVSPITYFVNWLIQVSDNLIHNYFVITLLGITLFISLVWLLFNLIFNYIDKVNNRYDDYNNKYYNYELLKEVQSDYLNKHYEDEYDYRYRNKVLNSQVLNGYLQNNSELDKSNKELSNFNKMGALKQIKDDILHDDDDSNDSDIDLIIPPKPQLASVKELNKNLIEEFPDLHNDLKNEINSSIDNITSDYIKNIQLHFLPTDSPVSLYNVDTGEVIDRYIYDKNYMMLDKYTGKIVPESDVLDELQKYHDSLSEDWNDSQGNFL